MNLKQKNSDSDSVRAIRKMLSDWDLLSNEYTKLVRAHSDGLLKKFQSLLNLTQMCIIIKYKNIYSGFMHAVV